MSFTDTAKSMASGVGDAFGGAKDYLSRAIDPNDKTADSLIVFGGFGIVTMCGVVAWDTVINKTPHPEWTSFGIGLAAILAGIGGGKTLRDKVGMSNQPTPRADEQTKDGVV